MITIERSYLVVYSFFVFSGLLSNHPVHGHLRREALRQRLSGAARAQVLPRPTGRPERRAGSGES